MHRVGILEAVICLLANLKGDVSIRLKILVVLKKVHRCLVREKRVKEFVN